MKETESDQILEKLISGNKSDDGLMDLQHALLSFDGEISRKNFSARLYLCLAADRVVLIEVAEIVVFEDWWEDDSRKNIELIERFIIKKFNVPENGITSDLALSVFTEILRNRIVEVINDKESDLKKMYPLWIWAGKKMGLLDQNGNKVIEPK